MKVLHIIPNLVKGGAQRIAIDICRELSTRNDIQVKLIYFDGEDEFEFLTKDIDVKRISVTYELSFQKKSRIDLAEYEKLLDAFQPDVIHSHLYLAELISREFPRQGILYFTHCHDNMIQLQKPRLNTFLNKQKVATALERKRLLKRYRACRNHFIAIANDGVTYLSKNLPAALSSSVVLLHNAIDVKSFRVDRKEPVTSHRLINVGNFIPNKNQVFLIEALAKIRSNGFNLNLALVGDGNTINEVVKKVDEYGLTNQITFYGRTDDVASVLQQASIYVHSAKSEQYGLVLLEAMAAGLPIVSLDGKGNRDLIQDGINGFLVQQGDLKRFVQCIFNLMNNPELYKRIQEEGYKTANNHDIRPYVNRLLTLYTKEKNKLCY